MLLPELLLLGLAVSLADSYDRSVNYWEAFAPGKLLQRLDALTVTDVDQSKVVKLPQLMQPILPANNQAQAKVDEDVDLDVETDAEAAAVDDVDSLSAETSHEGYSGEDNYERNYEQFVKEYFDRAAGDDDHDDGEGLEEEEEEETQAEATSVRDQRCRQVKRKDGQLCEICRQLKNNEVSETCSYSHDDQPHQYAYGSGSQYKRYRDDPAQKTEQEQEQAEPVAPSSLCVRRQHKNSVCYECKDSKGQKIERCYDVQARKAKTRKTKASSSRHPSSFAHKRKPRSQQSQQSEQEQRIYKRTISYSYAQGTDQQGQGQEQPTGGTTELPVPRQRRRRLVKITRRRGPAKVQ
ncbi:GD15587 [Drosophila simulans]|uniref:GD15587 n=1 Tax=Drosophila simulans TaxID=7240 RepID=B4R7P7_DROSI|nr:GD15587 [Drosophila simulans]